MQWLRNSTRPRCHVGGESTRPGADPVDLESERTIARVAGRSVILQVEVFSTSSVAYQWRFNGQPIPDANGPTLEIVNAQVQEPGYRRWGIVGVQGRQDQVPGLGRFKGYFRGLRITDFSDHDNIRILP